MGSILAYLHRIVLALAGKDSLLHGQNPLDTTKGVIRTLEANAIVRSDMTAVGRLRAAREAIVTESLRRAA